MYFNTDFQLGNISEILNNPSYPDSLKMFAALSTCDNSGILNYSNLLRKNKLINEQCNIKILLLTAAINLVSKKRNECVEILNSLGPPSFEKVKGWQQSYFYSTWQLLFLQLKTLPNIYINSSEKENNDKKFVIGDSHVFGMVPGLISDSTYNFTYIPGLRYSTVSSPQDNLKKVAIRNALASSYEFDQVIFSIGEIDTRSLLIDLFNNNYYTIKNSIIYFKNIYIDSIEYIAKYLSRNQELNIIIPPPPYKINKKFNDEIKLTEIRKVHERIIDELKSLLLKKNIKYLEYPKKITSFDGYVGDDFLVDHAHFYQDTYMEILDFKKVDKVQI
jgi:hypothetical protein